MRADVMLSDDVDLPGGRRPVIVEPATTTADGPFTVLSYPAVDVPIGTLIALRFPFTAHVGQRYYAEGWQSWSAGSIRHIGPNEGIALPRGTSRRYGLRLADAHTSSENYFVTSDAVAGFVSGGGRLVHDVSTGEMFAVRRHVGELHPPVYVGEGDGPALLDQLLDRCPSRLPASSPIIASTWEAYNEHLTSEVLWQWLGGVADFARRDLCELALVDDSWQRTIGDWYAHGDRFPGGLGEIVGRTEAAGVACGLWMSPFLAAPHSEVAGRRPDWIARHADGSPVVVANVHHWGGPTWALDVTRPDVLDWVTEQGARIRSHGVGLVKLDFAYAAASAADAALENRMAGHGRSDGLLGIDTVTSAALAAFRRGIGEDVLLLACGTPMYAAMGIADMARTCPDNTRWNGPRVDEGTDRFMAAGLENADRAARLRAPTHRRPYLNEPDALTLSQRGSVPDKLQTVHESWVAGSGQVLSMSDRFDELRPKDVARWADIVGTWRAVPVQPTSRALAPFLTSSRAATSAPQRVRARSHSASHPVHR